jgi:hypothetical protein
MSEPGVPVALDNEAVKKWRRTLGKGVRRTNIVESHMVAEPVNGTGDQVPMPAPEALPLKPAPAREVVDEIAGMVWGGAQSSPLDYMILARAMQRDHPELYGHMSDEELRNHIRDFAEQSSRAAVESVYRKNLGWDDTPTIGAIRP